MHLIRDARLEDLRGIVDVHIRTWQVAYAGQLPDDLLARQTERRDERTGIWERAIRNAAADRRRILVAEDGDRIVGFVSAGPSRDEADTVGEVYAIYVDPGSWGQGVGRDLFALANKWLAGAGFQQATLWVLGSNVRARRFYEAAGWRTDGATKIEVMRGTNVDEVRYRTQISAAR